MGAVGAAGALGLGTWAPSEVRLAVRTVGAMGAVGAVGGMGPGTWALSEIELAVGMMCQTLGHHQNSE
jgi:hypothetical protein